MAKTKKPAGGRTIIDVAHPGQSAPSSNSKSVIISNRPLLKDPMMVDGPVLKNDSSLDDSLAKVSNKSTVKPTTAPLLDPAKKTKKDDTPKSPEPPAPLIEAVTLEPLAKPVAPDKPESEPEPEPSPPEPKAEEPVAAEQPSPQSSPDDEPPEAKAAKIVSEESEAAAAPKDKAKSAATKQATQHQAAVDKLADSKKYYLPIDTVEKRRSRRFVGLGILLSLLLIVAWADIALDAGLIHIDGVKPLTHFFSN